MKNACVIFNEHNSIPERIIGEVFALLRTHGYLFEEERRLYSLDKAKLSASLAELQKSHENIFVFTGKPYLPSVKEHLLTTLGKQDNAFQMHFGWRRDFF